MPGDAMTNLFIYQARESSLVRAGFLTVSPENVIYEAFVVMGELSWGFSALLAWRKGKVKTSQFFKLSSLFTHSLSFRKAMGYNVIYAKKKLKC